MYLFHFILNNRNCLKSKCSLVDKGRMSSFWSSFITQM